MLSSLLRRGSLHLRCCPVSSVSCHQACQSMMRPSTSLIACRLTHHGQPPPAARETLEALLPHVPAIVSPISQIASRVPSDVMERVCEQWGGLAAFMSQHPKHFCVKRIGEVVVANRVGRVPQTATAGIASGQTQVKPYAGKRGEQVQSLLGKIPTFIVPVAALESVLTDAGSNWRTLLTTHRESIFFLKPPAALGDDPLPKEVADGFVGLNPLHVTKALREEDPLADALAAHQVQQYEWMRVARLLTCEPRWTVGDSLFAESARRLLPEGRDPLHVLFSAPHLFRWRVDDVTGAPTEGTGAASATEEAETAVTPGGPSRCRLSFQYILPPTEIVSDMTPEEKEEQIRELRRRLLSITMDRTSRVLKRRSVRRSIRRQLMRLEHPTPFLDNDVLAQWIFDQLPQNELINLSSVVRDAPDEVKNCFPKNLTALIKERQNLFILRHTTNSLDCVVGRADLDIPAAETATTHDILQSLYNFFPRRCNPDHGVTLDRIFSMLPFHTRKTINELPNFVTDVLLTHPDLVEEVPEPEVRARLGNGASARSLNSNSTCRFSHVRFRFRGALQDQLRQRFHARCEKLHLNPDDVVEIPKELL